MSLLEARIIPGGVAGESGDSYEGEPFAGPQVITDPFGTSRNNTLGYHTGVDEVPKTANRDIRFSRTLNLVHVLTWHEGQDRRSTNGGYGNTVLLEEITGDVRYRVAHLASFGPRIQAYIDRGYTGSRPSLPPGELAGVQGNTGYVLSGGQLPPSGDTEWGLHTHFEMQRRIGGQWVYVNPARYISGIPAEAHENEPIPPVVVGNYLAEAKTLRRTVQMLRDGGTPPAVILNMVDRELGELVEALGG